MQIDEFSDYNLSNTILEKIVICWVKFMVKFEYL